MQAVSNKVQFLIVAGDRCPDNPLAWTRCLCAEGTGVLTLAEDTGDLWPQMSYPVSAHITLGDGCGLFACYYWAARGTRYRGVPLGDRRETVL